MAVKPLWRKHDEIARKRMEDCADVVNIGYLAQRDIDRADALSCSRREPEDEGVVPL
jgi:hypothetical protein